MSRLGQDFIHSGLIDKGDESEPSAEIGGGSLVLTNVSDGRHFGPHVGKPKGDFPWEPLKIQTLVIVKLVLRFQLSIILSKKIISDT